MYVCILMHPWIVLEFRNSAVAAATLVVLLHAACVITQVVFFIMVETIWILRYAKKEIRKLVRKFVATFLIDFKRYMYEWITRNEEYFINFYSTKMDVSHQVQVQVIIIKSGDKLQLFFHLDGFVPFIVSLITKLDKRKYEKNQNRSGISCVPIQRNVVFEWQKIISWSIQFTNIHIEKFLEFYRFQSIGLFYGRRKRSDFQLMLSC